MHAIHRAAAGVGGHGGEQRRVGDTEPGFLALHVSARLTRRSSALNPQLWRGSDCRPARSGSRRKRQSGTSPRRRRRWPSLGACLRPSFRRCRSARRGSRKSGTSASRLLNGVGFSNGCAEFALKKPPPLVPSCLIASWEATGPCAMICLAPSTVVTVGVRIQVLDHALRYSRADSATIEIGSSTYTVARVTSTQKLPMVRFSWRAKPRIRAIATAMPAAADAKF